MLNSSLNSRAGSVSPVSNVCVGCGAARQVRYPRVLDPQTRELFAVEACVACGLGHTVPQPANLGPYYGPAYHGGRHSFTVDYCMRRRVGFMTQVAGNARRRILDVGCGDGTFLLATRRKGWEGFGTEVFPKHARDAGVITGESVAEMAAHGPFGVVTLWHSLEHMRDPLAVLREASEQLAEGGVLLVAVPDAEGAQARLFGPRWFHLDVPRHLFHFGERSLTGLFQKAGLTVVKTWHQELELDLFGWAQSALNALLPDPNVFFYRLTGRPTPAGALQVAGSFALGAAFTAAAVPALGVGTALGRGGTLVMAARRKPL